MKTSSFAYSLIGAAAVSALASSQALAGSLDVDINSDNLVGQYHFSDKNARLGLSGALALTDDKGEVFHFTVRTQGNLAGEQNIRGGFGGRLYAFEPENSDGFQSLALGGFLDITVPQHPELSIGTELYYGPSITTTDDVDNVREFMVRVSYQLFQNAAVYLGVRNIEAEQGDFDYEFVEGGHLGFSLQF